MPERTQQFGLFGARGARAAELVARRLDDLAGGIATPVTVRRGWTARLHYLTRSAHSLAAARDAGLTVTDRTLNAWLDGRRAPSRRSLDQIEAAYRQVRRSNVARYLLGRLNAQGRGTRVEIHPLNQSQVPGPRQRVLEYRSLNVRHWDQVVDAWARGDAAALDDAWIEQIVDLGSQWGQYEHCTNIGFAA
ncbi:transcriptional regulator [Streptomyces sp. NPDC087511]|uniref:transcriptional regulator n=1 Tax=Streptomyces sp. NPDC087511 TaxID=3365792 RepID=UPI003813E9F9